MDLAGVLTVLRSILLFSCVIYNARFFFLENGDKAVVFLSWYLSYKMVILYDRLKFLVSIVLNIHYFNRRIQVGHVLINFERSKSSKLLGQQFGTFSCFFEYVFETEKSTESVPFVSENIILAIFGLLYTRSIIFIQ